MVKFSKDASLLIIRRRSIRGRTPLTGERTQASLRGRPRGRLGRVGSGNGCLRGRPRGRLDPCGSGIGRVRGRPRRLGATQGAGATL